MHNSPFSVAVTPNCQGLLDCIQRKGTPERVYNIELFLDGEMQTAICERFNLLEGLDPDDPFFAHRRQIILQRFLGYDYVNSGLEGVNMVYRYNAAEDTADLQRAGGRNFMEEHKGPITSWAEFEAYPWPDISQASTRSLEWYAENLPEGMGVAAGGSHFAEGLTWLMGYESLCYALYDQRDLVQALSEKLMDMYEQLLRRTLEFDCVKLVWGSDDMGYRSGTLISPADMREFVLPGHKRMAQIAHEAGRPYLLHSCGNLSTIMEDLIEDVRIDAKHSFEDTIESVVDFKARYGHRIAALGGIDLDFICRADEQQVRRRVRETLAKCLPGGGYCLGTGNSVANYVPMRNYLAMLDEGRKFKL